MKTQPGDGGLIYAETNLNRFIAEPFNAASALIFLFIAAWWLYTLRKQYRRHAFLTLCTGLLAIGATGGTLYHAFRASRIFLVMDWLPILLLCLMAGFYFLYRISGKWWPGLLVIPGFLLLQGFFWNVPGMKDRFPAVNVNYFFMALVVLCPVLLFLRRIGFRQWQLIAGSLVSFLLALCFRIYDKDGWLPVGTHFLWHSFGALACHLMFLFIYRTADLARKKKVPG